MMKKILWLLCLSGYSLGTNAQAPLKEEVRMPTIGSIKFFKKGDQLGFPIVRVNELESLELHFDDLQNSSRSYYYTFVLCNADWKPANLNAMEYLRGFTQMRISNYRFSSGTLSRYVHYQAFLPNSSMVPNRSGNYLLKVFENGDTSKLIFSKRMLVLDEQASIAVQMQQPFGQQTYLTHQKIIATIGLNSLDVMNPAQELKVVVLQNNRWDNARMALNPTFIRGKTLEYSNEDNFVFEGGKEFRWLDLRSFRLQSDRVASINYNINPYDVFLRPDTTRSPNRYFYFKDMNGMFATAHIEDINPWWQSDYGRVHFTFLPNRSELYADQNIYLFGEGTNYQMNENTLMHWNDNTKTYETTALLKNGYYSYTYVTIPKRQPNAPATVALTDGSSWEAENQYTVLVYYTPFGARSDALIGAVWISSLNYFNPARQ